MVKVNLIDGYFVEIDEYNHTLKRHYVGEDKDGKRKLSEKIIGFYGDMPSCIERLCRNNACEGSEKQILTLREYAAICEASFKKCQRIKCEVEYGEEEKRSV